MCLNRDCSKPAHSMTQTPPVVSAQKKVPVLTFLLLKSSSLHNLDRPSLYSTLFSPKSSCFRISSIVFETYEVWHFAKVSGFCLKGNSRETFTTSWLLLWDWPATGIQNMLRQCRISHVLSRMQNYWVAPEKQPELVRLQVPFSQLWTLLQVKSNGFMPKKM